MTPAQYHAEAQTLERTGDTDGARALLDTGLAAHPEHPDLLNSAGNAALRAGDTAAAVMYFERAVAAAGGQLDHVLNLAIALTRAGRAGEATGRLIASEKAGAALPRYWTVRANAERENGDAAAAARSYDRALALDPNHPKGAFGRARMALERGEPGAVARYERALQLDSGNAELWLGLANAQDAAGNTQAARNIAEQLVAQAPSFIDALKLMAGLDIARGESAFDRVFAEAAARQPADPNIRAAWIAALAGHDRYGEAANVAAEARTAFPDTPAFALWEASQRSAMGDFAAAERLFATVPADDAGVSIQRARHALRIGAPDLADRHCAAALAQDSDNVGAWALRSIAWRLTDDPRHDWLHGREELARLLPLSLGEEEQAAVVSALHALHDRSAFPLGQSLRGGTQTRGQLFAHHDPVFAKLRAAVERTVEAYRNALPPADGEHPLLRHRDADWQLAGSWSVRLSGGADHHASHIHPQGIVSSALYLELPGAATGEGALELGRPPADLGLDLPPERVLEPRTGYAALFPSTLYHGTTPFAAGRRLTVAFDVTLRKESR